MRFRKVEEQFKNLEYRKSRVEDLAKLKIVARNYVYTLNHGYTESEIDTDALNQVLKVFKMTSYSSLPVDFQNVLLAEIQQLKVAQRIAEIESKLKNEA